MAGGMGWRRGPTLAERSEAAVARRQPTSTLPRHCWVLDPPLYPGRWPGVLLCWERSDDLGWRGRAVYAAVTNGDLVVVDTWLSAERLRPS